MARPKTKELSAVRKLIDLDKETIKLISIDAINNELAGFKPNAERILREYAQQLKSKKK